MSRIQNIFIYLYLYVFSIKHDGYYKYQALEPLQFVYILRNNDYKTEINGRGDLMR
jgi:hypothetical protein